MVAVPPVRHTFPPSISISLSLSLPPLLLLCPVLLAIPRHLPPSQPRCSGAEVKQWLEAKGCLLYTSDAADDM
eukprot:540512-Rhodomonas_salina.1